MILYYYYLPLYFNDVRSEIAGMENNGGHRSVWHYIFPVTDNYNFNTQCLAQFAGLSGGNGPTFTVGKILDKTGQRNSTAMTRGVTDLVISILWRTGKPRLVNNVNLRFPLAQPELANHCLMLGIYQQGPTVRPSNCRVACATPSINSFPHLKWKPKPSLSSGDQFVECNTGRIENEPRFNSAFDPSWRCPPVRS